MSELPGSCTAGLVGPPDLGLSSSESARRWATRPMSVSHRASSWDRTGGNRDYIRIEPGDTATLLEVEGQGSINHLYFGMLVPYPQEYRDAILRAYWDGSSEPSVAVPLGDFFGVVEGRVRQFTSSLLTINPGVATSHGLNAYFPMPFSSSARITLENRGDKPLGGDRGALWFHIDYELDRQRDGRRDEQLRFHATYRQQRPTTAIGAEPNVTLPVSGLINLDGEHNYVALDTHGEGRMAGLLLEINNRQGPRWYGEGDDMVFVDGYDWPPFIHGTGTEEIFGGGACPTTEYAGPYTGYHLIESGDYDGQVGMYRWFVHDPINFSTSLRWTIEHGHANNFANEYASVVYWYQDPTVAADPLPSRDELRPRLGGDYAEAAALLSDTLRLAHDLPYRGEPGGLWFKGLQMAGPFSAGDWTTALRLIKQFRADHGIG